MDKLTWELLTQVQGRLEADLLKTDPRPTIP